VEKVEQHVGIVVIVVIVPNYHDVENHQAIHEQRAKACGLE